MNHSQEIEQSPAWYSASLQIFFFLFLTISCKSVDVSNLDSNEIQVAESDSIDFRSLIEAKELAIESYQPSTTTTFDILHTELDLSFDYQKQTVSGKALLTMKPYFYPTKELFLDAQDFEIEELFFLEDGKRQSLDYGYDEEKIQIHLPRELANTDTFQIAIKYTAFPERNAGGGSEAITDTKGLYFIDPLDTIPNTPTMIWTQGETAHNSKWFPTIDSPNDKFTQLIKLTVADSLVSVGNGELIRQDNLGNGLRKDYWEMKLPHSAYLSAFAIGDFGKIEANWENVPLGYFVEKGYEKGAEKVFKNTPEMIDFFSELLGVRYPWPKYDQVVVRDFVSGAMENTTVSIFMEELRLTAREAIDSEMDYIIAHELFHQWFGDYVTMESWANLTLNEGFANYSEFLWNEYKYGADEAKLKLIAETESYFTEALIKQVPLIRFEYQEAEDMFDSHSYSKGGAILHMLREYLGKEAFYAGLNYYLTKHAFGNVEVNDLRMAFEKICGEDLNWFFNQWFLAKGHPELHFEVDYSDPKNISFTVSQLQNLNETPLYQIPLEVSWYLDGQRNSKRVMITKASQQFSLENKAPIHLLFIDEEKNILAAKSMELNANQMREQFQTSKFGIARYEALDSLARWEAVTELESIIPVALEDEFWSVRESALSIIQGYPEWLEDTPELARKVLQIAKNDSRNSVRAGALDALSAFSPDEYYDTFVELAKDSSYLVAGSALMGLVTMESQAIDSSVIEGYASEINYRMVIPVADYYITNSIPGKGDWFIDKANTISGEGLYYFLGYLGEYFSRFPEEGEDNAVDFLLQRMASDSRSYIRLGAFQGLLGFSDDPEILKKISEAASLEKDTDLVQYYQYFLEALKDEN
ncbi:M1 family metallopeptidase [Algoriphagus winogradskyi]|uniref:Aminopeptidase N n=1 Tax=Algoriphagus winogradskyi TaxID=237017 RepID=A0ABY1PCW4_9BACT|nr:M1 family metallopeptidase [Algoriphagus winogradskyi]SMP31347.1 aminopeptidase N [Algoriphagus winogradskyi]